jgi:DNA-nicking Smr family endonuclease|tara:strand:+ start:226 stop:462 length:237 start_codon:yes stop_codon:yes gene_type:complete
MKFEIDLHGMSINKAITKAESVLIEASFDKNMQVEIITGKSGNMKERIIEEVIKPFKFNYYTPSYNIGMIIVTQDYEL